VLKHQTLVNYTGEMFQLNCNYLRNLSITIITTRCIDDERQFKTAKRLQGDATVLKRVFCDIRHRSKRIAFLDSMNFSTCAHMQIFNFHDGNDVTIFRHSSGAHICQMPGHRLSRLAKGTPSESRLSIGTIGLG